MDTLRIVSHNAFWFQGRPFAPADPGNPVPEILDGLAAVYRRLAPDVLCLQEVQSAAVLHDLGARLGLDGAHCPGGNLPQYGGGVLWREGRMVRDWRSGGLTPERMWQVVEVPFGGDEVRVANVHLPSSRYLGEDGAAARRLEEMEAVLGGGRPDVVLGDFNEPPGGALGERLSARGYRNAADLTGRTEANTPPGGGRGDQVWVAEVWCESVAEYGVVPEGNLRCDLAGKTHLSDHVPLWIELRAEN